MKTLLSFLEKFHIFTVSLFKFLPIGIGKIFVGIFYGAILSFIFHLCGKFLIKTGITIYTTLYFLQKFSCITIHWEKINGFIGTSSKEGLYEAMKIFLIDHNVECFSLFVTVLLLYFAIKLYK